MHLERPHGSPRNTVEVTVTELQTRGSGVLVRGPDQPDGAPGWPPASPPMPRRSCG
ncbi:molybdate ABC superfamily ATP binding cassette transporter, ABC protein [Mycobacterium kansasii 824]|nr:molybdate ABC superfamily ATP binding cassette transporter, ABC protein [Mycobacterium kansasii 824]